MLKMDPRIKKLYVELQAKERRKQSKEKALERKRASSQVNEKFQIIVSKVIPSLITTMAQREEFINEALCYRSKNKSAHPVEAKVFSLIENYLKENALKYRIIDHDTGCVMCGYKHEYLRLN